MRVTVFGSSSPKPGDMEYNDAIRLGKHLGESGDVVFTGGYMGVMEAISYGAHQAGGHVIGVTCTEIENWRPAKPNPWVDEEIRCETLRERLFALIDNCEAALVLPGGIGTLAELAVFWSQLQTNAISPRPFILIGEGWKKVMDTILSEFDTHISLRDRSWFHYAPDIDSALSILANYRMTNQSRTQL